MKKGNVAIFVPHLGCPNQCSFCNQRTITSVSLQPTPSDVEGAIHVALESGDTAEMEIAFFGGSFTAIDEDYMESLLKTAFAYVEKGLFKGIRLSTRPDAINSQKLELLKKYGVTSIELGAQSMDDQVLAMNLRGHSASQVVSSSKLIKKFGFELGLQMMTGLYGDSNEKSIQTAKQIIELQPETVRIYPAVVLKDTYLCQLFENGTFVPSTLESSVSLCAELLQMFEEEKIQVLRVGLHSSDGVAENAVAGAYHPAFKELVESEIMLNKAKKALMESDFSNEITIFVNPKSVSKMAGQRKSSIFHLKTMGYSVKIRNDKSISKYELRIENGFKNS